MRSARWLASVLLLSACSGEDELVDQNGDGIDDRVVAPNNVSVVAPTRPLGHVVGRVVTAQDGRPFVGATVDLAGGAQSGATSTDDQGGFRFGPIAAGAAFSLSASASGYVTAELPGLAIDDAAGNFPTENGALFVGPVGLLPSTGKLTVQVVSSLGAPVPGAAVTVELGIAFLDRGVPTGLAVASGTTDQDGLVNFSGLPDLNRTPPFSLVGVPVVVNVGPADGDGDGVAELRGHSLLLPAEEVRAAALPVLIVLQRGNTEPLRVLSSNVGGLLGRQGRPLSVLAVGDNIQVLFNKPVMRSSVVADLRDEDGETVLPNAIVLNGLGNVLTIDPAADLEPGREYNLLLRASSDAGGSRESVSIASPLFAEVDTAVATGITGRFRDTNGNAAWGDGGDFVELISTIPIGRPGSDPAFVARVWLDLDLNGSGLVGDGQGELPSAGGAYPAPMMVNGGERSPANGAGLSGLTRRFAPIGVSLATPRPQVAGGVNFEIRLELGDNGALVTDVSGRPAPARTTGQALLQ